MVPVAVLAALPAVSLCAELPLPAGDEIAAPWVVKLFLDEDGPVSPAEAATFELADDADVGRTLTIGPWWCGKWSARVQHVENLPAEPIVVRGMYRTEGVLALMAGGRVEYFDADGKRIGMVPFALAAEEEWTPFTFRIDKFPPGAESMQLAFGLRTHTSGRVQFARLGYDAAGPHPLDGMAAPTITRSRPAGGFEGTGFFRVEQVGETWWLVDPLGKPFYSLATDPRSPAWDDDFIANCSRYVDQLRGWGFTGIAGWASATTYARYNDAMLEQGKPTFALFKVINFHDGGKYGEFDVLTDRHGDQKSDEHGFPDPFDPRFEATAYRKAEAMVKPLADRPDVIAWFVDNEMSFSELYRYVWSEHCGDAFVGHLRARYQSIDELNDRWGTSFADWDAVRTERPEPLLPKGSMYEDLVEFERVLVKRFIDISIAAVRAVDTNHLIASNRYNMGGHEAWMRTIDLASAYDIVACNLYPSNQAPGVGKAGLQVLREVARRTGRPMIMGEWSVPAMDSGLYEMRKAGLDWSFPQTVPTQDIRAAQAARIAGDYYNEPYMVGAHWFIYRDFDTEKREANRGLVRSDGTPYEALTKALTDFHASIADHISR